MKNLGAGSEVSSFGKELDFMAWFIPRLHGRQTVLFHQRGASPTACLYGLKANCDQPLAPHGRQTVLLYQRGASPTACLYGLLSKIATSRDAWASNDFALQNRDQPLARPGAFCASRNLIPYTYSQDRDILFMGGPAVFFSGLYKYF
jgi:hypothetical protein